MTCRKDDQLAVYAETYVGGEKGSKEAARARIVIIFRIALLILVSNKHNLVVLSSSEAEYQALLAACKTGAIWGQVMYEFDKSQKPESLETDISCCKEWAEEQIPTHFSSQKHIGILFQFFMNMVGMGSVIVEKVASKEYACGHLHQINGSTTSYK